MRQTAVCSTFRRHELNGIVILREREREEKAKRRRIERGRRKVGRERRKLESKRKKVFKTHE